MRTYGFQYVYFKSLNLPSDDTLVKMFMLFKCLQQTVCECLKREKCSLEAMMGSVGVAGGDNEILSALGNKVAF